MEVLALDARIFLEERELEVLTLVARVFLEAVVEEISWLEEWSYVLTLELTEVEALQTRRGHFQRDRCGGQTQS